MKKILVLMGVALLVSACSQGAVHYEPESRNKDYSAGYRTQLAECQKYAQETYDKEFFAETLLFAVIGGAAGGVAGGGNTGAVVGAGVATAGSAAVDAVNPGYARQAELVDECLAGKHLSQPKHKAVK